MLEWKKAKSPAILETTGLGPCIGVGIYIPEVKTGFMGHFVDPQQEHRQIDNMLKSVKRYLPLTSDWRAYLGGGGFTYERNYQELFDRRNLIIEKLKTLGFTDSQITINWNQEGSECTAIILNTADGQVTYDSASYEEYFR